jgi:hypothetical protein
LGCADSSALTKLVLPVPEAAAITKTWPRVVLDLDVIAAGDL